MTAAAQPKECCTHVKATGCDCACHKGQPEAAAQPKEVSEVHEETTITYRRQPKEERG